MNKQGPSSAHNVKRTIHLKSVSSTNDYARELAKNGAPQGTLIRADTQTKGRGRSGSKWHSAAGGLWISLIFRPPRTFSSLNMIPAIVSIAVTRTLTEAGVKATIKWPNDVMVNDQKIAGILCESEVQHGTVRWIVVGLGLNVNNEPPIIADGQTKGATSLSMIMGTEFDLAALTRTLKRSILMVYEELLEDGAASLLSEYNEHHILRGRKVRLSFEGDSSEGMAGKMDDEGRLQVIVDGHTERFRSEDIRRVEIL